MTEKMYKASDVIGILLGEITPAEYLKVVKRLSDIPSAVVRCKYCKHRNVICINGRSWDDTYFCADGKRRSE